MKKASFALLYPSTEVGVFVTLRAPEVIIENEGQ